VSQKWAPNGAILAVQVRIAYRFVALQMKILSQYRERRDGCMIAGVLEVKKEISIQSMGLLLKQKLKSDLTSRVGRHYPLRLMVRLSRARLTTYSIIVGVAACCLFLVVFGFGRSLWLDEAWVANSATAGSLVDVFYYPSWLQTSPPLFLLLVRTSVVVFGLTTSSLRTVPLMMGVLSATAMALLVRRLLSRRCALLAWTMFVLSPTAIAFSATLKQYSSELAAATLVLLVCIMYLQHTTARRFWLLLGTVIVGLLVAYPIAFVLPGMTLAVCFSPAHFDSTLSRSTSRRVVPFMRAVTLALVAGSTLATEYFLLISHNTSPALYAFWGPHQSLARAFLSAGARLLNLLPLSDRLLVTSSAAPITPEAIIVAVTLGMVVFTGLCISCLRFRKGRRKWLEILVICGSPCLLLIMCQSFSWYPLSMRASLFLLPFVVILLLCSGQLMANLVVSQLRRDWVRPFLDVTLVIATLFTTVVGATKVPIARLRVPTEDVASAVLFLRDHVQREDLLWVHASASESFKLYARILGWNNPPAKYGHTGWPCCPRGIFAAQGVGSEDAVRRDIDSGLPPEGIGKLWLLYTTRGEHWAFVGLDESQVTKVVLGERGCIETPTPQFHNIGISSFDCTGGFRAQNSRDGKALDPEIEGRGSWARRSP
jgi:4-amino-4-deoxy-L-arabinose transferase-like glycosyltransferase